MQEEQQGVSNEQGTPACTSGRVIAAAKHGSLRSSHPAGGRRLVPRKIHARQPHRALRTGTDEHEESHHEPEQCGEEDGCLGPPAGARQHWLATSAGVEAQGGRDSGSRAQPPPPGPGCFSRAGRRPPCALPQTALNHSRQLPHSQQDGRDQHNHDAEEDCGRKGVVGVGLRDRGRLAEGARLVEGCKGRAAQGQSPTQQRAGGHTGPRAGQARVRDAARSAGPLTDERNEAPLLLQAVA